MSDSRLLRAVRWIFAAGALLAASGGASGAAAQGELTGANVQLATRAELQAKLRTAESLKHEVEAANLRNRLTHGDFAQGDRVFLSILSPEVVPGMANRPDTLHVIPGGVLQLQPLLGKLELQGVLRSELREKVLSHIGVYLKDPVIVVTALMRIQVLGHVANSNYGAFLPPDMLLSDVVTLARPMTDATSKRMPKIVVKRADELMWTDEEVAAAMRDGLSIDRLHLVAGDQIWVERPPVKRDLLRILQVGMGVIGSVVGIAVLIDRIRR